MNNRSGSALHFIRLKEGGSWKIKYSKKKKAHKYRYSRNGEVYFFSDLVS